MDDGSKGRAQTPAQAASGKKAVKKAPAEAMPKTQVTGWCDSHGHETIACTACGVQWCPEPGHGCNCGKPVARS